MEKIDLHISHLLETEGSASLRGFGTIVMQHVSASVETGGVQPPKCEYIFESYSATGQDDESLRRSIMRRESLSAADADAFIMSDIEQMRRELSVEGECAIADTGRLCRTENGSIRFEGVTEPSISWLRPLALSPLASESADTNEHPQPVMPPESFMRSLRRTASAAAAVAIFVFLTFVFSQLQRSDAWQQAASFLPATQIPQTEVNNNEQPIVLVFNTPSDASSLVESEPVQVAVQHKSSDSGRYCLVVASLANRAEADNFMRRAANSDLQLLEKDGKYRVYSMTGDTYGELMQQAERAGQYELYPNAWICLR